MKLYNSPGPNPRTVRMFLAEKGIDIPRIEIDIIGGENRSAEFLAKNPAGQLPVLETDSGLVIAEVPVICEYLEELFPQNSLFGETAEQRAETRMWYRRIDTHIIAPMVLGFRYDEGAAFFSQREPVYPPAAIHMKELAQIKLGWLNTLMKNKQWVCDSRFSFADIALFCFIEFGNSRGQALNPDYAHILSWLDRMKARPSSQEPI